MLPGQLSTHVWLEKGAALKKQQQPVEVEFWPSQNTYKEPFPEISQRVMAVSTNRLSQILYCELIQGILRLFSHYLK